MHVYLTFTVLTAATLSALTAEGVASDAIWDFTSFSGSISCVEDYSYPLGEPPEECHDESHVDIIATEGGITQTTAGCAVPDAEGMVELDLGSDGDFDLRAYAYSFEFRPSESSNATTEIALSAPFTVDGTGDYELRYIYGFANWYTASVAITDDAGTLASNSYAGTETGEGYSTESGALSLTLTSGVIYTLSVSLEAGPGDEWPNEFTVENFDLELLPTPTLTRTWTALKAGYQAGAW